MDHHCEFKLSCTDFSPRWHTDNDSNFFINFSFWFNSDFLVIVVLFLHLLHSSQHSSKHEASVHNSFTQTAVHESRELVWKNGKIVRSETHSFTKAMLNIDWMNELKNKPKKIRLLSVETGKTRLIHWMCCSRFSWEKNISSKAHDDEKMEKRSQNSTTPLKNEKYIFFSHFQLNWIVF